MFEQSFYWGMWLLMNSERLFIYISLVAHATFVLCPGGMNKQMATEAVLLGEAFVANVARERPFTGMYSLMLLTDWVNNLPHTWHSKDRSPVWIFLCFCRLHSWLKFLLHMLQLKGFSPVCILSWIVKLYFCAKPLPHLSQIKHFSRCGLWLFVWVTFNSAVFV